MNELYFTLQIGMLSFMGESNVNVQVLNLSHNNISQLLYSKHFKFPFLKSLNLSHNQILSFSADILVHLPFLRILDMSHNYLEDNFPSDFTTITNCIENEINLNQFCEINHLKELYIHNNRIKSLNQSIYNRIARATLHENNWSCDQENLHWMMVFNYNIFKIYHLIYLFIIIIVFDIK